MTLRKLTECQKMSMIDRLSGKRRAARRELRKLNARRKALNEACNKISVLAPLFQSYNDSTFDGRNPFVHEQSWRDKLRRREQRILRQKISEANRPAPRGKKAGGAGRRRRAVRASGAVMKGRAI